MLWPSHRHDLVMSPDSVLYVVQAMVGTFEEEPYVEPTQEEIDEWMIGMMDDVRGEE